MAKLKNLGDLSEIYSSSVQSVKINESKIKDYNEILLTDAAQYLPESAPKVGEGFGKDKEELAKDTGPKSAEGFKAVTDKQDPGSSKKAMKKEAEDEAGEEKKENKKNVHQEEAAKQTQPKEKIQEEVETASKSTKYKKQSFTMSKSKFDQLYEDAINGAPFVKEEEEVTPVAPAPDAGGDAGMDAGLDAGLDAGAEETITHDEAIELARKLLAFLEKDKAHDVDTGTLGDEDQGAGAPPMAEETDDETMDEAVEAEDRGHANVGSGVKTEMGKDKNKIQTVGTGTVTQKGGTASEQGASFKNEPTPKKEKESANLKDGHKIHTVGNLKTGKALFDN